MNNTKIVIAKYRENVDWINKYFSTDLDRFIIYNKGYDLNNSKYKVIPLKNIGRESHTYLYHIINNYDRLDDYTIFTQADPFKHSKYFIDIIRYCDIHGYRDFQPLTTYWLENSNVPPPNHILYDKSNYIKNYPIYMDVCDYNLMPYFHIDHGLFPLLDRFRKIHKLKNIDYLVPYIKDLLGLHNKITTTFIKFNYGAIFGVKKDNIIQHDLKFYQKLYDFSSQDDVHAYILERLWYTIFY
jgi:hypothetical protein